MRKRLVLMLIVFLMSLTPSHSHAAVSRAGVLFLRIAAGARAAGIGESFVAISDDATATHWNPAGLGFYPLNPAWIELPVSSEHELQQIALTENETPEVNYKKYDIWARTEDNLLRWDGNEWVDYFVYQTLPGEKVKQIIEKYVPAKGKEDLPVRTKAIANLNTPIGKDSLEFLMQKVIRGLPVDYEFIENVEQSWQDLLDAWDDCLIDEYRLSRLLELLEQAFNDGIFTVEESNQISLAVDKVISKSLKLKLKIPYKAILLGKISSLSHSGKSLWVGTDKGLYRHEKNIWTSYQKEDGLPSDKINVIAVSSSRTLWVGTDAGLAKFSGKKWIAVPFGSLVSDQAIVALALRGDNEVWVATPRELLKYNGRTWIMHEKYMVKPGDSLEKIVGDFLGFEGSVKTSRAVEIVKQHNSLKDQSLNQGQMLELPYNLAVESEITRLCLDLRGNLWLGTKWGIKRYTNQRWTNFGYILYRVQPGDDVEKVAEKFVPSSNEEKVERLIQRIVDYNGLDSSELQPGQKIYVYVSITGSETLEITPSEGYGIYVGTRYGTLFFDGDVWTRYYHCGLEKAKTNSIVFVDREMWLASKDKLVIYAHARREATAMYANWLPELASDLYYAFFSYSQYAEGWGTLGGNFTLLSLGKNVRTGEMADTLGVFSSYEAAFTFSYGTRLSQNLAAGISAKLIYSHLSDQGAGKERGSGSGSSVALDAGILYDTPIRNLTLGAALTNIGPDISYIDADQADPLPRNLAVGVAYKLLDTPYNKLLATFEVNKELLDSRYWGRVKDAVQNMGVEYWYGNAIALRTGYINDREGEIQTPTFGAGLTYNVFRFDFAYIPSAKNLALSNTMRFSVTGNF